MKALSDPPRSTGSDEAGFSMPARDERAAWGREGARRRWGDHVPRVIRLDDLTPEQRRVVLAFVELERAKKAAEPDAA